MSARALTVNEPAEPDLDRTDAIRVFSQMSGVGEATARSLYDSGFTTLESLARASVKDIHAIQGIGPKLAKSIRSEVASLVKQRTTPPPESTANLTNWLTGSSGEQAFDAWIGAPKSAKADPSLDALRKWLTGEEGAFQEWLGAPELSVPEAEGDPSRTLRTAERQLEEQRKALHGKDMEVAALRAELDALRATVARDLATLRTGNFDPVSYIAENAALNKDLQGEIAKRKELHEELEHIKKGSIAVIKYLKSLQLKSGAPGQMKKQLADASSRSRTLESDLRKAEATLSALRAQVEEGLLGMKPAERDLKKQEISLAEREAAVEARETEIAALEAGVRRGEVDLGGAPEELRRRLEEELREKEQDFLGKEDALKKRIILLEEEVSKYQIEEKLRQESKALEGKPPGEIEAILAQKGNDLLGKEKSILLREKEIQHLREEIQMREDEMKKLKDVLGYKEEEMLRREEDMIYREKLLQAERRKVEEAKALGGSTEELELKERLDLLKSDITQKEEEVRAKEKYLGAKMEELRLREQGLIGEEIEAREEERLLEVKQDKVKTGTSRLDDLMLGGIPFGSNISCYGPAYVGKEVVVNAFMAEGLKKGVPVLWIITDKMAVDIREEMRFILPGYEEYEKLGLVRYVDAYSKSIGAEADDPYTTYVDDPTDHQSLLRIADEIAVEYKRKHPYYRLAFRSISTLITYLDPTTTFKFLQPFAGRRKRDKAVSMYVIEKGMHEEQEIQMLGSVMDGAMEFKVEQLRSFLAVRGVSDVQSRAWIRYSYTKQGVSIGSFSLDHIK